MAAKTSLRDYQSSLVARLRSAGSGRTPSKLGVQVGNDGWLVDLVDAGEVIPVPAITPVPLTRPWFKGLANIRGNLYSIVDFSEFIGGPATTIGEHARLLLVSDRHRMGSALLVERSLGLRNPEQLQPRANAGASPWLRGVYDGADGRHWKELDVPGLIRHPEFLDVGA